MSSQGAAQPIRAAVITLSDKASVGLRADTSGPLLVELLRALGAQVAEPYVIPDDQAGIESLLMSLADDGEIDLVLTTGGTGLAPRDHTPEATLAVADRLAPGFAEAMRAASLRDAARDAQPGHIGGAQAHAHHQHAGKSESLSGTLRGGRAGSGARGGDSARRGIRVCDPHSDAGSLIRTTWRCVRPCSLWPCRGRHPLSEAGPRILPHPPGRRPRRN